MITAKGKPLEWHEGMTVLEVLKALELNFPFVLVKVDDQIVKKSDWETFKVPDRAKVDAIPIVAGG